MSSFAERLNRALVLRGISAAELSRAINVNEATVSNYRKGKYEPKQKRTEEIAKVLSVSVAWLMGANVSPEADFPLTLHEKKVMTAYRAKPEMQNAVDTLLGISAEEPQQFKIAARSGAPITERPLTDSEKKIIENNDEWHGDDEL